MNVAELAGRLLHYTDHRTLAEANTAGVEYLQSAIDALNAAAQYIYLVGPESISARTFGFVTDAPKAVTVTYDTAWHWATAGGATFAGRAFKIDSEEQYNRVITSDSSDFSAERPAGSAISTAVAATVWHDAIALDAAVTHVLPEVTLNDELPLRNAGTEADLYLETRYRWDYGERFRYPSISAKPPIPAKPNCYLVQSVVANAAAGQTQPVLYLRLAPFPDKAYTVKIRAKVRPPKVVTSDLDAANNGAACTKEIPMPAGWDELFLLPIARQYFSAGPFFNNESVKGEFARAFTDAIERLSETRPQKDRPVRFVPEV